MKNYEEIFFSYCENILNGDIVACQTLKLCAKRFSADLKRFAKSKEFVFDSGKASKVCRFIENLKHVNGEKAGEKITLEAWEIFLIFQIFGWTDRNGNRRFFEIYMQIPRGNGKSLLCSAISLYMLCADGEKGANVYCFATTREQAKIVFNVAAGMVNNNTDLQKFYGVKALKNAIFIENINAKFEVKAADSARLDGLNPNCCIIDELHAHKKRDLYDVVKSSFGKRRQPLLLTITTAGYILDGVCMEKYIYSKKILNGDIVADRFFSLIFEPDKKDSWKKLSTAEKVNPNWGVSVNPESVKELLAQAMANPQTEKNYRTKYLNEWQQSYDTWISLKKIKPCITDRPLSDFLGKGCIYGLDLATRSDLTALVRLFWEEAEDGEITVYCYPVFFLPENTIKSSYNANYEVWAKNGGVIPTEGDITDLEFVQDFIKRDAAKYDPLAVAFDPWQATQLAQNLLADGLPMVQINMTTRNLSEPMKKIQEMIFKKKIKFQNSECLFWNFSNVIVKYDANGNIFPRKDKEENKIDGVVALIMAINRLLSLNIFYADDNINNEPIII